jgi:hypothetical protein
MKITKMFAIFSCVLILSMLLSAAGVTASPVKEEAQPEGMPDPVVAFGGLRRDQADPGLGGDSQVPDSSGDAGITRYIQAVNKAVAMYTKAGTLIADALFDEFWDNADTATVCDGNPASPHHHGQPNVLYDHMSQRWVITDLAYTDVDYGPYYICMAVSNYTYGEAPPDFSASSWLYYALPVQNQAPYYLPEQHRIGLWPDGYYIAADLYDIDNNGTTRTAQGARVWAVNRDDLVNHIVPFRAKSFHLTEADQGYHGLLPSNLEGDPPPTGTPNFFVAIDPPNLFYIWPFTVDWTNMDDSTFPSDDPTVLTMALPYEKVVGYLVDQYGTTEKLDIHSDRLNSVAYRIVDGVEALWASHTIVTDTGDDDVRWYEVRDLTNAPFFYQQGSYAPDTSFRWVSSLAVDAMGNMAIGFSYSNESSYPSVVYTGRLVSDPVDTLPQGEKVLVYGTGYQDMNPSTDEGPWGQRSMMSVDPVDPCIFWYTNQYYVTGYPTIWRTVIGAFRYPTCMQGTMARVSLHTSGAEGDEASGVDFEAYSVDISGDGRYVVFSSEATTLVDGDTNGKRDIFLRDRDTDLDGVFDEAGAVTTTRISNGLSGAQANADSWQVSISGDGLYVAFASDASNLVTGDTNGTRDVFRYSLATAQIVRVSVSSAWVQGNALSDQPSISYYGDYVAFRSYANNLVPGDANDPSDIFVRDVTNSVTSMVSITSDGTPGNADSFDPAISGDGRVVAFASRATNLISGDNNGVSDIFAYDRMYGTTLLVSARGGTTSTFGNDESYTPSVNNYGDVIAFTSHATNLDPSVSDGNGMADVFVRKVVSWNTHMISRSFFGDMANADSYTPSVSGDGMFIAFASDASTLDLYNDMNGVRDIFLHDLTTGLTRLISRAYNGSASNGRSVAPAVSYGGRFTAFPSRATNLVTDDTNNKWDVFVFDKQGAVPTFLSIPTNIPAYPGNAVSVPLEFTSFGQTVDTATFSIDFDEDCLNYNSTTFTLPDTSAGSVGYDASDIDGELDFVIQPLSYPSVPLGDGQVALVNFTVDPSCQADPDGTRSVRVGFSTDPRASFGAGGTSVPGGTTDGTVVVLEGYLGDCNGDIEVDAGDLTALVLEIFDGDGNVPADAPFGEFDGGTVGCNPNQDLLIDAGDVSCEVMLLFDPNAPCGRGGLLGIPYSRVTTSSTNASLSIAAEVPGPAKSKVNMPVTLVTDGSEVSSLVFSVDYDRSLLSFDPADADQNGIPDAVKLYLPNGFSAVVSVGEAGEIDFVIYAVTPGLSLADGVIANIELTVGKPQATTLAPVTFFYDPPVSLGNTSGQSVPVAKEGGSVWAYWWVIRNFLPFTVIAP